LRKSYIPVLESSIQKALKYKLREVSHRTRIMEHSLVLNPTIQADSCRGGWAGLTVTFKKAPSSE